MRFLVFCVLHTLPRAAHPSAYRLFASDTRAEIFAILLVCRHHQHDVGRSFARKKKSRWTNVCGAWVFSHSAQEWLCGNLNCYMTESPGVLLQQKSYGNITDPGSYTETPCQSFRNANSIRSFFLVSSSHQSNRNQWKTVFAENLNFIQFAHISYGLSSRWMGMGESVKTALLPGQSIEFLLVFRCNSGTSCTIHRMSRAVPDACHCRSDARSAMVKWASWETIMK